MNVLSNPEKVHPAFGQRRYRSNGRWKEFRNIEGKEVFDAERLTPVWLGYSTVERDSKL